MEEENDKTKLIAGIVVVVVILILGFFIIRGFLSKSQSTNDQSSQLPNISVAPTSSQGMVQESPTPTNQQSTQGSTTKGGIPVGTTNDATGSTGSTYYYQSQSSSNSRVTQSQDQNNTTQSQSQTLPNGASQSQSQ